jgi:peroxiredoxin
MANPLTVGDAVVDFTLPASDGKTYNTAEARHKGLLLFVFYKKTCGTCQYAFPYLQRFHTHYTGDRFRIWGVAQENAADTAAFAAEYGATFPQLVDESLDVTEKYDLAAVPGAYLVDETGKILLHTQAFDTDTYNAMAKMIAERTEAPYTPVVRPEDDAPALKPG